MKPSDSIDAGFFSGLRRPTSFFVLRHGETTANADRRIQGRSEYPLNDNGRAQAADLAGYLADKGIERVFHSPLSRAAETAAIVSSLLGLGPPEAEPLLVELDTGRFSGLTLEEIETRYPEEYRRFKRRSWEAVPDAERASQLYLRAMKAWEALGSAAMDSGGNIAAISHGGTIQWLVRVTFGCRSWMPLVTTGNCGIFELYVEPAEKGSPAYVQWKNINLMPGGDGRQVPQVF